MKRRRFGLELFELFLYYTLALPTPREAMIPNLYSVYLIMSSKDQRGTR